MPDRNPAELRPWLPAAALAALAALAACHAPAVRAPASEGGPIPEARPPVDASYDWHVLAIAPFGGPFKDIPLKVHEALLFRDETPGAAAADDGECYTPDDAAPRFMADTPDQFLLCFKHDRLARIQASVHLRDPAAPELFAAACAQWLHHASPAATAAEVATAGGAAPGGGGCEGSDGGVRFSAHLDEEATLSIVLDGLPEP